MLVWNHNLKELYLGWNRLTSTGGIQILIGLEHKENLAVLDISHNSLGQRSKVNKHNAFIKTFCKLLPNLFLL